MKKETYILESKCYLEIMYMLIKSIDFGNQSWKCVLLVLSLSFPPQPTYFLYIYKRRPYITYFTNQTKTLKWWYVFQAIQFYSMVVYYFYCFVPIFMTSLEYLRGLWTACFVVIIFKIWHFCWIFLSFNLKTCRPEGDIVLLMRRALFAWRNMKSMIYWLNSGAIMSTTLNVLEH